VLLIELFISAFNAVQNPHVSFLRIVYMLSNCCCHKIGFLGIKL
jgi:hypothetical protein